MEEKAVTVVSDSETKAPTVEEKKEEKLEQHSQPSPINHAASGKSSEQKPSKSSSSRRKRSKSRSTSAHIVTDSSCSRSRSSSRHNSRRSASTGRRSASSGHKGRRRNASTTRKSRSRSASPETNRYASRARSVSRQRKQAPIDQVHEDCTKIHVVLQDVQETAESITSQASAVEIAQVLMNTLPFTYRARNNEKQGVPIIHQNKTLLKKTATLAIQNLAAARLSQGYGLHCNHCNKDLIATSQNSLLAAHVCSMCLTTVWCDGKCHESSKFAHHMVCIESKAFVTPVGRSQSSGYSASSQTATPTPSPPSFPPASMSDLHERFGHIPMPSQQRERITRWPAKGTRTQCPTDWKRNMKNNEIYHDDVMGGRPFFWHQIRGCYVLKNDKDRDCKMRMNSDFVMYHATDNDIIDENRRIGDSKRARDL
jgi:myosin heavy subunit